MRGVLEGQGSDGEGYVIFPLEKTKDLSEFDGKLVIDWGDGFLAWAQYADKHDKQVIELRSAFKEEDWPGYLEFIKPLSEIPALPSQWKKRLREAKGIYLLTCPRTKEQYVGKASGDGGFQERLERHEAVGGDAVRLSGDPRDYQVSILEVVGSGASDNDIRKSEELWIKKLQSRLMGLNGNPTPIEEEEVESS